MRKILIPTDFSDNAQNAKNYAVDLFKYEICEFYFLHAYQDEVYADEVSLTQENIDDVAAAIGKASEEKLKDIVANTKSIFSNPRHSYHIISANNLLVDEANKIVDDENIDLILMGTRGKTDDRKLTFGSNTLQVLKYVQCPVLAIPQGYKYTQPKHILFTTDYMIPYKRRELKLLCEIAAPYRATIDMLYVSKSNRLSLRQEDNRKFIENELGKNTINFKIDNSKHVINAVYKHIKENNTDILVMVNTRYSILENILFQSTIDELSLNLDIPFLALQNMRRN